VTRQNGHRCRRVAGRSGRVALGRDL